MRIAHISDIHYCPEHLAEVDLCFRFAVDGAINAKCKLAVLSGDLFDHRLDLHTPAVGASMLAVRELAEHMPVLILQGTFSHDVPGSLEPFRHIAAKHPVTVADTIGFYSMGGAAIFCIPTLNKADLAVAVSGDPAAMGDHIAELVKSWAPQIADYRKNGIPTVLVSHGTVSGSITEQGVPMAGLDHEFTTGTLFASGASAIMLGHIHQYQEWEKDGRRIAYPGSVGRLHFGELTPKGFLVWDVTADGATTEFVPTPAKRLLQTDIDGVPDLAELAEIAAECAGAYVRIRYCVDEEYRKSVDHDAIRALFAAAAECKIEARINPIQRTRSAGISRAVSMAEKVERWADVTQTNPKPLVERLALLEHKDHEQIIRTLTEDPGVTNEIPATTASAA